jgi:hypothetical protein
MDKVIHVQKPRKERVDRAKPHYRLTQCKLEKIETIISGYSKHRAVEFKELTHQLDLPVQIVSLTSGFLSDMGILDGDGNSLKSLTANGKLLGNAIAFKKESDRVEIWRKIIIGNGFCIRFIQSLGQSGKVSREGFRFNIMRIAGYNDPEIPEKQVGANALIELFTQIGYVTREGSKTSECYSVSNDFGEDFLNRQNGNASENDNIFINKRHIIDLEEIPHMEFDATRLIKYCYEVNDNFRLGNYSSVIFLCRAILDHCPPIFGYPNFASLSAQMPKSNVQKIISRLDESLRQIAIHHIHKQIGPKEVLPVIEEIDFRNEINTLIGRIIERFSKLKSND